MKLVVLDDQLLKKLVVVIYSDSNRAELLSDLSDLELICKQDLQAGLGSQVHFDLAPALAQTRLALTGYGPYSTRKGRVREKREKL